MPIDKKKTFLKTVCALLLTSYLCPESGHTMESPNQAAVSKLQSDIKLVEKNLKEDSDFIQEYLHDLEQSELHFFWTTGFSMTGNEMKKYGAKKTVEVGGTEYGQKFFPYIDLLLNHSTNKLKVKFVCDPITENANDLFIKDLTNKYKDRFETLHIYSVIQNLKENIPDSGASCDATKGNIDLIFKNAREGNPVLASDIYRVVGMVYGHEMSKNIDKAQYTYCDVDTFCYGMESTRHADLITALFKPNRVNPFYMGRTARNNDLIKLTIQDLKAYRKFSQDILEKASKGTYSYVLRYFSKLHDIIADYSYYDQEDEAFAPFRDLEPLTDTLKFLKQVVNATGPSFLDYSGRDNIKTDLNYPSTCAGSWFAPDDILIVTCTVSNKNYDSLYWGYVHLASDEKAKEMREDFNDTCQEYRKTLSAAYYAMKFGAEHPFNLKLRKCLIEDFPYNTPQFKKLLRLHYELQKGQMTYDNWKNETLKDMNENPSDALYKSQYQKILFLLKNLGINIGFTTEDIVQIEQYEKKVTEIKKPEIKIIELKKPEINISSVEQKLVKSANTQVPPMIVPEISSKNPDASQSPSTDYMMILIKSQRQEIEDQAKEIARLNELVKALQKQGS